MKKGKIIGLILFVIVFASVIIFAATRKYDDTHLKLEGIRVRVPSGTLVVAEPNESNEIYAKKVFDVNGKEAVVEFKYKDMQEDGYPKSLVASINNHQFLEVNDLDLKTNMTLDYQIFLNFKVMGDYVVFSYTKGTRGRTTTLYAVDLEGNIVLNETDIDENGMKIKDYTEFLTYGDNNIEIYASKLDNDVYYKKESICKAKDNELVEAYYTYTLKNGKFTKKQTKKVRAKTYIADNKITCDN